MKNKTNLNRVISIILILFLTVFTLISCQSPNNNTTPTQSPSPDAQTPPDSEQAAQPEKSEFTPVEGADYGGYRFRILGSDGKATGTWQAAAISEIIAEEETGDPINDAFYKRNREIESLYNITFDIVPVTYPNRDDFAAKFTKAALAGDDLFDAAFVLGVSLPKILSRNNITFDLLTLTSLDFSKSWWDQNSVKSMSVGGKLNSVIGDVNLYSAFATVCVFAHKQLMQDYSVPNLYQLVREGKWTWDIMYDIMKSAVKDLNGDGIINKDDQVGLFMQHLHLYDSITSAGEYIAPKNEEDIPVFAPNMDKITAIADKLVPIFNDKNSAVESGAVTGYNNAFFDFIMPKFRDGEMMFHINQLMLSFELRNMEADFAILPLPKIDETQANYGSVISQWWSTFTVIPITCTDTDRTGNMLEAMGYYSQQYVMPAYYNITVTNKLMRDEDSIEMIEIMFKNRRYDLAYYYDWGSIQSVLTGVSSSGNPGTIVSQLEKAEPKINTAIQKTLDELIGK
jgi:hypothetical protein